MTGLNYITNDEGVRTALFIDLERLRKAKISDTKYRQFLEEITSSCYAIPFNNQTEGGKGY